MNNGTTDRVIEHFNRVALLPDVWDHNRQYQNYMLRQIRGMPEQALEIGCGTGEFCRVLSARCRQVIGIDIAPVMMDEAGRRNSKPNIQYVLGDVNAFLDKKEECFDVITSIAAFHHLDFEVTLEQCKKALKPGGVLILQDLYHEKTLPFLLLSFAGMVTNPIFMLLHRGRLRVTKTEQETWAGHRDDDSYMTMSEIKTSARRILGQCRVRRRIFWRYTLVYRKPE